ncbi:MAG: carboxymuconolactone decarboxylase family protein [Betaproteobacteria bacterium]|jgi:4-carboxymuconolactone decarboxylase
MTSITHKFILLVLTSLLLNNASAQVEQKRFKTITTSEMTPEQKVYFDAMMSGPVSGTGSAAVIKGATSLGAPFNVYLRSPALAEQLRQLSEQIRFKSSLPPRLNEFAILIIARHWGSQYEWYAHQRLALKAGLDQKIADQLAQGQRPLGMREDEEVIYNFSQELLTTHEVSDANYDAVLKHFGEKGVVDLIGVSGYYVLVSMILNVDRSPLPPGATSMPKLKN